MAKPATTQLSPKHWKALELLEEGTLSVKEIAQSIGWSPDTLYDLMSGDTQKTGNVGLLFQSELKKQHARNVSRVKHFYKENQRLALIKLNERLRLLQSKHPTEKTAKEICTIMNSLGKTKASVEINQSYSFTKGLTAEELVHEFKRLATLARSTLDGGGVSSPESGRPGTLPSPAERGGVVPEES